MRGRVRYRPHKTKREREETLPQCIAHTSPYITRVCAVHVCDASMRAWDGEVSHTHHPHTHNEKRERRVRKREGEGGYMCGVCVCVCARARACVCVRVGVCLGEVEGGGTR